jgi:hypothetical protein
LRLSRSTTGRRREDARPVEYILHALVAIIFLPCDSLISWTGTCSRWLVELLTPTLTLVTSLRHYLSSLSEVLLNERVSHLSLLIYKLISIGMLGV